MSRGDLIDPIDYGSIVRNNLMKRPGYAPYCGHSHFTRLKFDGEQFVCACGFRTNLPEDFIAGYKERWSKPWTGEIEK